MALLYVTADRQRFVPAGDPEAAFGVAEADIDRLGLRDAYDEFTKPKPKAQPAPANKMAARAANKAARKAANK